MPDVDSSELWSIYGRLGMQLYGGRDTFVGWAGERAFALLTGEPIVDLNLCSLQAGASAAIAGELIEVIDRSSAPAVVAVSMAALDEVDGRLRAAGFEPLGPEVAMWRRGPIDVQAGPFTVRRVQDEHDFAAAVGLIAEGRKADPSISGRVFNLAAWHAGTIGCWIAWDGGDAAATMWLTAGEGYVGVWEMVTSPRHRRRGAARAALTTGMGDFAAEGSLGTILWSTPLGRPLYESLGFEVFDNLTPWVRGGSEEELALIGASVLR
jgi:GNAT superfamily N-acetyltransferase